MSFGCQLRLAEKRNLKDFLDSSIDVLLVRTESSKRGNFFPTAISSSMSANGSVRQILID
jgi:hypothetical protein